MLMQQVVGVHLRRAAEQLDDVFSIPQKSAQKKTGLSLFDWATFSEVVPRTQVTHILEDLTHKTEIVNL